MTTRLIGTNNTVQFTAPEIAEGVGAVVMELRCNFLAVKILGRSGQREARGADELDVAVEA
jgi:hypothetical protein